MEDLYKEADVTDSLIITKEKKKISKSNTMTFNNIRGITDRNSLRNEYIGLV
jgi:hypothetical protein